MASQYFDGSIPNFHKLVFVTTWILRSKTTEKLCPPPVISIACNQKTKLARLLALPVGSHSFLIHVSEDKLYHLRRSMPLQRSYCIENRTHKTKPTRSAYESGCETAKGTTVSCHNFNLTRMPSIFCQVWISEFPWVNNSAQSALLKTIVWSVVEGADKTPTSHQQKPQTSEFEAEVYLIYRTPLWVF